MWPLCRLCPTSKASVVLSSSRDQGLSKHLRPVSWITCTAPGRRWGLRSWLNHPGKGAGSSQGRGLTIDLVPLPKHRAQKIGPMWVRHWIYGEGGREKGEGTACQKGLTLIYQTAHSTAGAQGLGTGWLTVRLQVMENWVLPTYAQKSINFWLIPSLSKP